MDVKMADRLMELRRKHGYSQEQLADKLSISRQAVSKWERAESSPDTDNLIALAKLYDTTIDEMLYGEEFTTDTAANKTIGESAADASGKSKIATGASGVTVTTIAANPAFTHVWVFPYDRKKALKITSYIFLGLGVLFLLVGLGFFLGFSVPESRDLRLAQNESIAPISAQVTYKIKTNLYSNNEQKYRVVFAWKEGNTERTGQSNAVYSEAEADELVGKTIQIRTDGDRAVMVDYIRSDLSIIGFVFIGVFGGLGVFFVAGFVLIHILNNRQDQENKSKSSN